MAFRVVRLRREARRNAKLDEIFTVRNIMSYKLCYFSLVPFKLDWDKILECLDFPSLSFDICVLMQKGDQILILSR